MKVYYSAIFFLCFMALGVLGLLVHENGRLKSRDRKLLYFTFVLIGLSAMAEYSGVFLEGREDFPSFVLAFIKIADHILAPMAVGTMVLQMRLKNRWRKQNHASLYAAIILVIAGVLIQGLSESEVRTAYIALTIGAMLLFIQYTEHAALEMDDYLKQQQLQIDTDPLTGVRSRSAYYRVIRSLDMSEMLPAELAVFTIDINGLKRVNDSLGHDAGDELICGAADCIRKALAAEGNCYRTGGDEFVVLTSMNREMAKTALIQLKMEADHWQGKKVKSLSLSAGCALMEEYDTRGMTAEMLVRESDKAMYEAKAAYYRRKGNDRRRRKRSSGEK